MEGSTPASHTVGLYSTSKFVSEGRHDITVEVWSAPGGLGVGELEKDGEEWRRKCQVLGVSTQMALTIPFEVNLRRGKM